MTACSTGDLAYVSLVDEEGVLTIESSEVRAHHAYDPCQFGCWDSVHAVLKSLISECDTNTFSSLTDCSSTYCDTIGHVILSVILVSYMHNFAPVWTEL